MHCGLLLMLLMHATGLMTTRTSTLIWALRTCLCQVCKASIATTICPQNMLAMLAYEQGLNAADIVKIWHLQASALPFLLHANVPAMC